MFQFELLLLLEILLGILIAILIQKINQMKKQVGHIIQEVEGYIAFITEEESEQESDYVASKPMFHTKQTEKESKEELEKAQTHLIQTVLQEYFP